MLSRLRKRSAGRQSGKRAKARKNPVVFVFVCTKFYGLIVLVMPVAKSQFK